MHLSTAQSKTLSRNRVNAVAGVGVSRPLVLLMALACGVVVANIYYLQPLLPDLRVELGPSPLIGLSVTSTQVGYALGLVCLVPLGDLMAKRQLVLRLLVLNVAALVLAAASWTPAVLFVALTCVGTTSVAVNVLIPFAATLARDDQRGRVLGTMMTGLLLGILLARTVSGALGEVAGWRAVYCVGAAAVLLLALVLRVALPDMPAPSVVPRYREVLRSVAGLIASEGLLRRRMLVGALGFASFQLLWTALPTLLADPPFRFSSAEIGLFGLVGVAGVLCAPIAGHLQDRGRGRVAAGIFTLLLGAAWLVLAGPRHVWLLAAGITLLDLGVQGLHVLNQSRIYAYRPEIRGRITTAYMTAYFTGGAVGSLFALVLYPEFGWDGVCSAGGLLFVVAAAAWLRDRRADAPATAT